MSTKRYDVYSACWTRIISSAIAAGRRMASRSKQRSLPGLDQDAPREETSGNEVMVSTPRAKDQGDDAPAGRESEPCDEPQQPVDIKGWNVYVVDAHSLIFQVFHALPEMSSPRGEQVGAVFGFVRDMLYLIEEKKPDALICAFDLSGPDVSRRTVRRLQGRPRRNAGRAGRPDPQDRARAGGAGDSRSRVRRLRGRRRAGHRRPDVRRSGRELLSSSPATRIAGN